jgi:hypothetical protein
MDLSTKSTHGLLAIPMPLAEILFATNVERLAKNILDLDRNYR